MLLDAQAVIIGSGAGGSTTAHELVEAGVDVLMLEEGEFQAPRTTQDSRAARQQRLYRRGGMTPILGRAPIGYAEGRCVGGSTEINSGFWHRLPPETLLRWRSAYGFQRASATELEPHFDWAEKALGVGLSREAFPTATSAFAAGAEQMGWSYMEVPRAAPGCKGSNQCAYGCPNGSKQSMTRNLIPRAVAHGMRLIPGTRVLKLIHRDGRVSEAIVRRIHADGRAVVERIKARQFFICCGAMETPALLLRSGIRSNVGKSLRLHPYLKVVARFDRVIDGQNQVVPLLQVNQFWPEISFGGAFFSTGQLAMTLSDNWLRTRSLLNDVDRLAHFYVSVRGSGRGTVNVSSWGQDTTIARYELTNVDLRNLGVGLARLSLLLLAAGAREVYPSIWGVEPIRSELDAARWLETPLTSKNLSLVTVHAFSSCPAGEYLERCAVDSFGRVHGMHNLFINDGSMLPDSPGVNPQGAIMAIARRNVHQFLAQPEKGAVRA